MSKIGSGKIGQPRRDYSPEYKSAFALGVVGAGFVRMAIDAALLYYTYTTGHGMLFGFAVLLVVMAVWSRLVTRPLYDRAKEVFGAELKRSDERNTTWKELAFAVAAAFAKKRGNRE